jgi:antitoxin HigA-1
MIDKELFAPIHPGEILLEEFLKPMGISQNRLAISIGAHARRTNEFVLRKGGFTADTALRLARFFGTTPQFWMNAQSKYELNKASDELGGRLEIEVRPCCPQMPEV